MHILTHPLLTRTQALSPFVKAPKQSQGEEWSLKVGHLLLQRSFTQADSWKWALGGKQGACLSCVSLNSTWEPGEDRPWAAEGTGRRGTWGADGDRGGWRDTRAWGEGWEGTRKGNGACGTSRGSMYVYKKGTFLYRENGWSMRGNNRTERADGPGFSYCSHSTWKQTFSPCSSLYEPVKGWVSGEGKISFRSV